MIATMRLARKTIITAVLLFIFVLPNVSWASGTGDCGVGGTPITGSGKSVTASTCGNGTMEAHEGCTNPPGPGFCYCPDDFGGCSDSFLKSINKQGQGADPNALIPDNKTASDPDRLPPRYISNPLGTSSIAEIIARIISIFTAVSGSIALLMFVYGGFLWLTSGGSPDRVQAGRKAMSWAVIGLVIIFGSYAILSYIFSAIGASVLQ